VQSITLEDIAEISILQFSSVEAIERLLNVGNINRFKNVLYLAISVSVNNIVNSSVTRTTESDLPFRYRYIFINEQLEIGIREKCSFRYVYIPTHPDAILRGEQSGYVRFPNIDIFTEQQNIERIINILFKIK